MSSLKQANCVKKSITELLDKHSITEVTHPFIVNPLTVSVSDSSKERLVLDLRNVNTFVDKQKVKFEGVKEAMVYTNYSKYAIKFDLKSGYHHLEIHPEHIFVLVLSWKFGSQVKYFNFTVLPFGSSSAGHIFTKTLLFWSNIGDLWVFQ
jgi:hypothetical protein